MAVTLRPATAAPSPVHLGLPLPEPDPVHDCAKCEALARQREHAKQARDVTGVSDCNVQIRRHPHQSETPIRH